MFIFRSNITGYYELSSGGQGNYSNQLVTNNFLLSKPNSPHPENRHHHHHWHQRHHDHDWHHRHHHHHGYHQQVQEAVVGQVQIIIDAMHFKRGQIVSFAECMEVSKPHTWSSHIQNLWKNIQSKNMRASWPYCQLCKQRPVAHTSKCMGSWEHLC